MTTKEQYQQMYKDETGHDFQRSPLEPMEPIIPIEFSIRAGVGSILFLFACVLALVVLR